MKSFYDWYLPKARDTNVNSLWLVLKNKRSAFDPKLVRGVEETESIAGRNRDAGLDFDWILNSQDPGDPRDPRDPPYSIRDVKHEGDRCLVDVYITVAGEKIVVPELRLDRGRWIFVNFHYPNSSYPQSENLLSLIRNYLKDASDSPKRRQ